MVVTDATLAPVHRHVAELERRVASQSRLVEGVLAEGGDPIDATRTLLRLESALRVAREHLSILLSARARWYPPDLSAPDPDRAPLPEASVTPG